MAKQTINLGTSVNKGDGDPLRTAFTKINQNFDELYNTLGINGSIFNPLSIDSHLLPATDNAYDLGAPDKQWRDIFVSTGSVYIGDIKLSNEDGRLLVQQVTDVGLVTETPVPDAPGSVTTDRLINGSEEVTLEANGNLLLANGGRIIGGSTYTETMSIIPNIEKDTQIGIISQDENEQVAIATSGGMWQFMGNGTMYIPGDIRLPEGGDILDSTGTSVLGGGTNSPIQPYLELTDSPFIIQPVTFGEPVTVTAPVSGTGALVEVVIGEGPVIDTFTITSPGSGYVVGQRYKIWYYQIGSGSNVGSDIEFEVATVGENGELLTVTTPGFSGTPTNSPGTYEVSIELYSSVRDEISPDVILTRGRVQGLYNIVSETEYDTDSYASPLNTEWNSDGWDNLVGIGGRSFTTFRSALNNYVGENIIGAELVMRDVINDKYYKFSFSDWGQNNGGSYSYTRTEITDPNFFRKTDNGDEVDVFVADDGQGAGIGITRGGQQGIYNPYRDEGWDGDFTPSGTEWNLDGWDDFSDVESRTYTNFFAAYGNGGLGNRVPGSKAVMYIPETDTYYAIQWLSWTQNANGGGFTYVRYELDLTKLNEGVRFPDGTVLKSAEGVGRVKLTAPGDRRIEEVAGYKSVSVTSRIRTEITGATYINVNAYELRVKKSTEIDAFISPYYNTPTTAVWYISFDNVTFREATVNSEGGDNWMFYYVNANDPTVQVEDAPFYIRRDVGGDPVVWWDKNDLTGGSGNFRGATIDYHAYTGESTIIGTIHIVNDSGENHISHSEVASGSSDGENDDLWLVQNEGTISYRRIDGESKTLKIQWTAKVFYGTEFYD